MPSLKVLLIEPTRTLAKLVMRIVEQVGGSGTVLTSGADAALLLRAEAFDLVCFAATLGGPSAFDFARQVRAQHPTLPLLMLIATPDEAFSRGAQGAGVTQVFLRSDIVGLARYLEVAAQRIHEGRLEGRVLLVEDSVTTARFVSRLLSDVGLCVVSLPTAEEALAAFAVEPFDVVVTDIVLAGASSGVGLVRDLRSAHGEAGARIPILAMSALDDTARRVELIRSGVSDLLLKPVLAEELIARVGNLLRNKRLLERVEAQQAELRSMALTDQLTQLHNRHFLVEAAQLTLSEARRHGHPVSLLVLDIDRFKAINDTHGHATGDAVLSQVAALLKRTSRAEDLVARFGGEEFVLLLPHCGLEDAARKAEVLRQAIEAARPSGIVVTVSIGVAGQGASPSPVGAGFDELFGRADRALYEAKSRGRNCVVSS
jgi:two-component system cell cycle response regulator